MFTKQFNILLNNFFNDQFIMKKLFNLIDIQK